MDSTETKPGADKQAPERAGAAARCGWRVETPDTCPSFSDFLTSILGSVFIHMVSEGCLPSPSDAVDLNQMPIAAPML